MHLLSLLWRKVLFVVDVQPQKAAVQCVASCQSPSIWCGRCNSELPVTIHGVAGATPSCQSPSMVWQVLFRASNAGERFRQRSSYWPLRFSLLWLLGVDVIGRPLHLDALDWRLWLIAQTAPPHNTYHSSWRTIHMWLARDLPFVASVCWLLLPFGVTTGQLTPARGVE